ncbi:MAG TPA: response regulator [Candidatus Dormibacteraeota bacterium]|nr:response regulator [Candidatus Dormibacteraeota bacterium]
MSFRTKGGSPTGFRTVIISEDEHPAAAQAVEELGLEPIVPKHSSIQSVVQSAPRLIVIDWSPSRIKENTELVRAIRNLAATRDVPIIVWYSEWEDIPEDMLRMEAVYPYNIPGSIPDLIATVRKAMRTEPLAITDTERQELDAIQRGLRGDSSTKGHVLIVLGDTRLSSLAAVSLQHAGFETTEILGTSVALSALRSITPDLILLDTKQPDGNGFDFCARVRADSLRAHIPIIFLTASAGWDDRTRGLQVGAHDYITVPWSSDDLVLRISNLVLLSRQQRAAAFREVTDRSIAEDRPSMFIICGKPDEDFGSMLKAELKRRGVDAFLFCEDAIPGAKLHRVMRAGVNTHERVVLVCSRESLNRPGVLNEIEETLAREAREGGETILIPIRLDDYVLEGWQPARPDLAIAIRDRVVANFSETKTDEQTFQRAVDSLMSALTFSYVGTSRVGEEFEA